MTLVSRLAEAKTVQTPAATMRTVVSPSAGPDLPFAAWWTELAQDVAGPTHTIDGDQLLVVIEGIVEVRVGDDLFTVPAGDAVKLPAHVTRVIHAVSGPAKTFTVGHPNARARVGEGEPVIVPWTA